MSDERYVIDWCHAIGVTVHVRGTDERVVIDTRDKGPMRNRLGGSEVKRRMEAALARQP